MADKTGDRKIVVDREDVAKKSGKGKIIAAVVCLAFAGAAYMIGTKSSPTATDAGAATTITTTVALIDGCINEPKPGVPEIVIDLPEMSINLLDGHYLRAAVSLGLCADVVLATPEDFRSAPAKDIIVSSLSGSDMTVLSTAEGRAAAKQALTTQISAAYPGVVYEVYFVEFVMQ